MTGVIDGGWGYVWWTYGITWSALVVYTGWIFWRLRAGR